MSNLLNIVQIEKLCNLGLKEIKQAMECGGEPDSDNEIIETNFVGLNKDCKFVYEIIFYDDERDAYVSGKIYVNMVDEKLMACH